MDTLVLADQQGLIHQFCAETGYCQEDLVWLPIGMDSKRDLKESMLLTYLDNDDGENFFLMKMKFL